MTDIQSTLVFLYGLLNFMLWMKGFHETKHKHNAYGLTPFLLPIGVFVWADAVIFCTFWTIASVIALLRDDWVLFLLIVSLFWAVRALGEITYWFHQQFSPTNRNPIEKMPWNDIFHNDSVWFVLQTIWQCVFITSLIFSLYFATVWLRHL